MSQRISLRKARWLAAVAVLVGLIVGTASANAGPEPATFGPIPQDARVPGADVDLAHVPDFVSVIGPDGEIAGYVSKVDLFAEEPTPASPEEAAALGEVIHSLPVYDTDGNVIGTWFDQKGFVADNASDG